MIRKESELLKNLAQRLRRSLSMERKGRYVVKTEVPWRGIIGRFNKIDIAIYKGSYPYIIFEVKSDLELKTLSASKEQVRSAMDSNYARFGVVTNNEIFYLYDRNRKNQEFEEVAYNTLIERFVNPVKVSVNKGLKKRIQSFFLEATEDYLPHNTDLIKYIGDNKFLDNINFSENSNTFYFQDNKTGLNAYENQFFIQMFGGPFIDKRITRYTTLNTLYSMLNYMSFRMNGLVGMNDKTEVNYVESYLKKSSAKAYIDEHHATISAINRRYITSCTTIANKDNLTMWRLYADDTKGVCLTFNINSENLNDHVLLHKVKYADRDGKHPELEILKLVIALVQLETGFPFEFRKIGIWKHFFKPFEYSIEDEVRLLVIDDDTIPKMKNDWVLTYTHSILNPIIDFQLNSSVFPIQLKEIMLGPKCPEQEVNKVQIEEMLRQKRKFIRDNNNSNTNPKIDSNLSKIDVELSTINHYR